MVNFGPYKNNILFENVYENCKLLIISDSYKLLGWY